MGRSTWAQTVSRLATVALLAIVAGCGTNPQATKEPRTDSDRTELERRAQVRLDLAAAYFSRGQYETALDEVKQALVIQPDYYEALSLRNLVYAAMGHADNADEGFRRLLARNPKDADTAHNYGWFLCQQRRFAQAWTQFDAALAQPHYQQAPRTMLARGVCEARSGDLARAEVTLGKAFEMDPGNPGAALNLAEVLYKRGQAERALFYAHRVNAQPDLVNAASLWMELRIERRLGHDLQVRELSHLLRSRYPNAPETMALLAERFDD